MKGFKRRGLGLKVALLIAVLAVAAIPAAAEGPDASKIDLDHVSEAVAFKYLRGHDAVPASRLKAARSQGRNVSSCGANANKDVFNCDNLGLPQNEESMAACPTNDSLVLQGTNDYRGLVDPEGNFTGWEWSVDGGHSVQNEGLLPTVKFLHTPGAHDVPSGGDPVDFLPAGCDATYAASLAYDAVDPFGNPNGVAVYKSTPAILSSCQAFIAGFTNPACWPVRRMVAETDATHFLDKDWMFVGVQNGVRYVWVTYTDFTNDNSAVGFSSAEIKAVRCDQNLVTCTAPIPISTVDQDTQFSDVTVGPDGRAVITWVRIDGEIQDTDQTFTIKVRTETAPGSAVFGPEHVVQVVPNAIPFGGLLHANDFRVATVPKNDVVMVGGHPRQFVIYDECLARLLGTVCEEPQIKLTFSDNDGATWSPPSVLSDGGDNYFPSISADRTNTTDNLAATWFTNRYDNAFHNQQDVVATSINSRTGAGRGVKRLNSGGSNEPEADPLLGGLFIGDYIEAVLIKNRLYVGANANYRKVPLLGGLLNDPGQPVIPVNQQDNYTYITGAN
jgi:hypothetical protein